VYHIVTRRKPEPEDDDEPEKKERVIHTRVPESLEAHLRERAQELGMSVSNLVRNVIGHAFGLVGDVAADSHAIARAARGEAKKAAPSAATIDDVIGWQTVVLNKNAVCAKCNAILPKGKDAAIGAGTTIVICTACLKDQT
jgi:predicted DNA-binding protein